MDATQMINDSILESDEEENEEVDENKRGRPLAKLRILKNDHIPETELPLFSGENVLGRDPNACSLPLPSSSISKQHATISISVYRRRGCRSEEDVEALVWDLGSMNGTRKGRLKLTPNVRYALGDCDTLVLADIPCQYVSCVAPSQLDLRRSSGEAARSPCVAGEKGSDTGANKCGNGGRVSLSESEDTKKSPARITCLSFEKTPTQPQGTLVPESDSDSDAERGGVAVRRHKAVVSESDSFKSSPTCSTFLSPTNKIIPESEDESPITPSSSTKNRPHRHVSFSKEETDVDAGRQQLKEKKACAIVDDSEEEEEERAAQEETLSEERGQDVPAKRENNVSPTGEYESPVSSAAVLTDAIPAFNMDSDTDVEGEEEGLAPAIPVTLGANQQVDPPPNSARFYMDSDTDLDEDDEALDKASSSADGAKPVSLAIHPEAITMDSDTDVDDDAAVVSVAAPEAQPDSFQSSDSAASTQPKDFHVDSDTDVDEEEETQRGTINTCPKIDETPSRSDIKTPVESAADAPQNLHLESDTDDEAISAPAVSEPLLVSAVTEPHSNANTGAELDVLSDSDTDAKGDSPPVVPFAVTTSSVVPGPAALQSDSDADTDVDAPSMPPAGDGVNPANLHLDSDTDVEDEGVDVRGAGEDQVPSLDRENTHGLVVPLLQNCSTPLQVSEGEVDRMETDVFLSPSSRPFRCVPNLRPKALSPSSDSQEEEDFVVAETQSFILQTRGSQDNASGDHTMDATQAFCLESSSDENGEKFSKGRSFQLGLSDSSHLQEQAQALAMESTQAFVSEENTQAFTAISKTDGPAGDNDLNLEETQAYGEDKEPARSSVNPQKEGRVDLAFEATQAYISEPYCDSEDETDEDERNKLATCETQPLDFPAPSSLAMAETQLISAFVEQEHLDEENPISSELQVAKQREGHGDEAQLQDGPPGGPLSIGETQPMHLSDDEDLTPCTWKRKAKPLQLEEEQTQPLTSYSLVETQPFGVDEAQPMASKGNQSSDDKDSQTITNSELSVAETQPMFTGEHVESDDEDAVPARRRRKVKQLDPQEEASQTLTNSELSVAETQPLLSAEHSDDEDLMVGPRKRKAKPLQLEDEQTQSLPSSEVSAVETQLMVTRENGESDDDEDSIIHLRNRKAKPLQIQDEESQPLTNSEASVKTQPPEAGDGGQSEAGASGITTRGRRATRARLREEEEQCSEPPMIKTRARNRALPAARGRRRNSRLNVEEEEEVKAKQTRGKKSARQLRDDEDEDEETERNRHAENISLTKEQEEEGEGRKEKEEQERMVTENAERLRLELEKERIERERREQEEKEIAEREEKERLERERVEREEKQREEREKVEREKEREEREKLEKEEKEREEHERVEREKEREEREKVEKEDKERLEREKVEREEREEREKVEKEEKEREEREKVEREKKEREEREKAEKEEKERLEREKVEKEEKEREEREKVEREKKEREEREKVEKEDKERLEREKVEREKEREEREKAEKEEKERLEREKVEREKKEREEREKAEKEEKERLEREKVEREKKEREEREKLEREEKEREEREKVEREKKEREEKARKENEKKERLEMEKRELQERLEMERQEHQARLESEAKEREERGRKEKEKQEKEAQEKAIKEQEENKAKVPARGRRGGRRTTAAVCEPEPEQSSPISPEDDVPARRTRSRSNSVSSERSASSITSQESRARGRGRGATRPSEPPEAAGARSSRRRTTVAAGRTQTSSSPQGALSRSNSSNSLNSDISSCSSRGRGRGRGRGRKTEVEPVLPVNAPKSAPKPGTRGRKSRALEESSNPAPHEEDGDKTDSQQAAATRGRQRGGRDGSETGAADQDQSLNQEEASPPPKRNIRGRGQRAAKSEAAAAPVTPEVRGGDGDKEKRPERKRALEEKKDDDSSSSSKMPKGAEKTTEEEEEEAKDKSPVQAGRKGRASSSVLLKKNARNPPVEVKVKEEEVHLEEQAVVKRGRGRPSGVQRKKKEQQEESGTSADQGAHVEASEPQTPTSAASRKRQAPPDSSPRTKSRRSSCASPSASGRLCVDSQAYKVLFTGVVDEAGERVLAHLGGSMAKGVADMNCLVTDKVRRTVKFLCAVAKGVPIVTTHWLEKSGKAGSFLPPNAFIVKDPEQEKKFNFCLQESLRIANSQPLLQGYEIHVTKSVKPEPVQMKDILTCSGATFLAKMPTSLKPQTVVISCEEDWRLCGPALSASVPVVTAEFVLTGILQQKADLLTHSLPEPPNALQPAAGRGRGRKKS